MSFDELQQMSSTPAPAPEPEPEAEPEVTPEPMPEAEPMPSFTSSFDEPTFTESSFAEPSFAGEDSPFAPAAEPEPESVAADSMLAEEAFATPVNPQITDFEEPMTAAPVAEEAPEPEPVTAPLAAVPAAASGDLTDDQIDKIARRVVQLMSEQVVRNIAWEVIPDLAEMVVKERIRQLESEA
jgi:hypothetical protein